MCAIDAVGYQARSESQPDKENPEDIINQIANVINPTGSICLIGVWFPSDPGAPNRSAKKGHYTFPIGLFWEKGISIGMGQCPVKRYDVYLRNLIMSGRAKPSFIVSHRIPLSKAPEAYSKFDLRGVGAGEEYTKVLLKPKMDR
jgi:glutathione-independent formaldehyde dehydrogenase